MRSVPRRLTQSTKLSFPVQRTFKSFHSGANFKMASSFPADLNIEATNIKTATGVSLSDTQQTLVGSVLDLFAGRPSLAKLQLWLDDGEFHDPIALAKGRKQVDAQWYGLQTAFSEIERLSYEVQSAGNPIEMDLRMRYKVKGIGSEQTIQSKVLIHLDQEGKRIAKVEDKWNGKLPDGAMANVSPMPGPSFQFRGSSSAHALFSILTY